MKQQIDFYIEGFNHNFKLWLDRNYFKLALFNIMLVGLVLLRSAGYFEPFFPLTINIIVFISLVVAILLLNATDKSMFITALIFLLLTAFFKIFYIDLWAERAAVYSYQALMLGVVLLIIKKDKTT